MVNLYYLAHPYSGDHEANVQSSIRIQNALLDLGIKTFNPLTHSHYTDVAKPRDPDFWYHFDLLLAGRCDGLILSPGWEKSKGCLVEYGFFLGKGAVIHVYDETLGIKMLVPSCS